MTITNQWEQNREAFTELPKAEFDILARGNQFTRGPLMGEPSKFMREFGPYSPERWTFGETKDGRLVCCNTTKENQNGNHED